MVEILHVDGFLVIGQSLCFLYIANVCKFFPVRALVCLLGFADFALGLNLLGVGRLILAPSWYWLRSVADGAGLLAVALYLMSDHMPRSIFEHSARMSQAVQKRLLHW